MSSGGGKIIDVIKECIAEDAHLTSCDDDGYCNYCGYQDGWDYENDDWLPEYK